jgi:hypothetical protein
MLDKFLTTIPVMAFLDPSITPMNQFASQTLDHFETVQGDFGNFRGNTKATKIVGGVDPVTGKIYKSTSSPTSVGKNLRAKNKDPLFFDIDTDTVIIDRLSSQSLANAKAQQGGFLKPGAKVTEGYTADVILKNDLQGLSQDLKNPKLIQQLKQYRVEAFLTEEGKVLNQLLASEIPPDLLQFLTKVRDIRNNYYLNISGKAVTGGEALRSYGAVPQPGDDAQGMLNKVGGMAKRIDDSIQLKRQLYGLPEINLREGARTKERACW